jgi:succinate dehydrogenase flavin-adding protein (antitoxin of CptAB toxin-antitoxin module)
MKELDALLQRYLERDYAAATCGERAAFDELLELQDPELYSLCLGGQQVGDPLRQRVIARLGAAD